MDYKFLIALVEQHDVLYNNNNQNFNSRIEKKKAWQQIAAEMAADEKLCIRRWFQLRKRFTVECRKIELNANYKPLWLYMNALEFLKPHINTRQKLSDQTNARADDSIQINSQSPALSSSRLSVDDEEITLTNNNWPEINIEAQNDPLNAFKDMIISVIATMDSRKQIRTMRRVTDLLMTMKLGELMEQNTQ